MVVDREHHMARRTGTPFAWSDRPVVIITWSFLESV